MTFRDQAIIDAVGQAYRNTGKAVPSVIVAYLPPSLQYSPDMLKKYLLPPLVQAGLIEKRPGRWGYRPKHQKQADFCPCCGRLM